MWVDGPDREKDYMDWVFYVQGQLFNLWLQPLREGSLSFKEQPYRIVWELQGISPIPEEKNKRSRLFSMLKEALGIYSYRGICKQAPGITVITLKLSEKLSAKFTPDGRK